MAFIRILAAFAVIVLLAGAPAGGSPAEPGPSPKIHFPEERYAFSPVMEGADITHDFVVENRGAQTLSISQVKTD